MMETGEEHLSDILSQCTDLLRAGGTVADCCARFPDSASELEPLLATVARVVAVRPAPPQRDPNSAAARRADFVRSAYDFHVAYSKKKTQNAVPAPTPWWQTLTTRLFGPASAPRRQKSWAFSIISYLLLIAFTGILITGAVSASAAAIPGDLLYGVKTASENVRVFFTWDAEERAALQERYQARRLDEAHAIIRERRPATLPLQGRIEQLTAGEWLVSGLTITLTSDTLVEGSPAIGARVEGRVRAPGDGRLIGQRLEVLDAPTVVVAPTTAPATPVAPTVAPTPLPTATEPPLPTPEPVVAAPIHLPPAPIVEPTDAPPTPLPTPPATATATRTRTPTRTPSPTPNTREWVMGRVSGWLMAIDGSRWLVNEVWVETDANTHISGNPQVGGKVEVLVWLREDQAPLATEIVGVYTPPTIEINVTGVVQQVGAVWVVQPIDGPAVSFRTTEATQYPNGPAGVGDTVEVKIEDRAGDRVALIINRIDRENSYVDGPIEFIGPTHWIIDGKFVAITGETTFGGIPAVVGANARADGYLSDDKTYLIATHINVY